MLRSEAYTSRPPVLQPRQVVVLNAVRFQFAGHIPVRVGTGMDYKENVPTCALVTVSVAPSKWWLHKSAFHKDSLHLFLLAFVDKLHTRVLNIGAFESCRATTLLQVICCEKVCQSARPGPPIRPAYQNNMWTTAWQLGD